MRDIPTKLAASLALIIGSMAFVAGLQVLLGNDPGYYVIDWLPVYNYTAGILTALVTATLVWRKSRLAWFAAIATISVHSSVMLALLTIYRDVVAADSIRAMTIRILTWAVIIGLMYTQVHKSRASIPLTAEAPVKAKRFTRPGTGASSSGAVPPGS